MLPSIEKPNGNFAAQYMHLMREHGVSMNSTEMEHMTPPRMQELYDKFHPPKGGYVVTEEKDRCTVHGGTRLPDAPGRCTNYDYVRRCDWFGPVDTEAELFDENERPVGFRTQT